MKTVLYGSGEAATQIIKLLDKASFVKFTGVIDDVKSKIIDASIPELDFEKLKVMCENEMVEQILVAIPSLTPSRRSKLLDKLLELNTRVIILPSKSDLSRDNIFLSDIRSVNASDLVGTNEKNEFPPNWYNKIDQKTVLITGAGGSIGSSICSHIKNIGAKRIIAFDHSEFNLFEIFEKLRSDDVEIIPVLGDITVASEVEKVFSKFKPDLVFHAAAYKHVELVQLNIKKSWVNNVLGTLNILEILQKYNIEQFILVSSDKAVRPTNFMGASKRVCELLTNLFSDKSKNNCKFKIVRFGNVIGSSGSVVPIFEKQIDAGGPVTVRHPDLTRYFMTIEEAAKLVIEVALDMESEGIYLLDMGNPIRINDLAEKLIKMRGFIVGKEGIEIKYTGLKPGEKMFEELLIDKITSTKINKRIYKDNNQINLPDDFIKTIRNAKSEKLILEVCDKFVEVY